jgi:hypothetical protein
MLSTVRERIFEELVEPLGPLRMNSMTCSLPLLKMRLLFSIINRCPGQRTATALTGMHLASHSLLRGLTKWSWSPVTIVILGTVVAIRARRVAETRCVIPAII